MEKLTDKQERFCQEYLIDLNATQAAIRSGYSQKTAKEQGCQNLTKLNIQERIAELQKERNERTQISQDQVIIEIAKLGFSNIQDYVNGDLSIKDLAKLEREKTAAIQSVKKTLTTYIVDEHPETKETIEFKLHDKLKALDMLGRHTGIYEKDNGQKQPVINVNWAE